MQLRGWGKDKLAVLLRRQKVVISVSMVGRILTRLKQHGRLVEPPRSGVRIATRTTFSPLRCAQTQEYAAAARDLNRSRHLGRPSHPRRSLRQFTARDVVSRWDVLQAPGTPQTATQFLDTCSTVCRFLSAPSSRWRLGVRRRVQQACQQRGLHLFNVPPRSPKLNGAVNAPVAPTPRVLPGNRVLPRDENSPNFATGRKSTIPFALIRRWAI